MKNFNIKTKLSNDYVVVCDTNVFLNIYRYSPEFTEFALNCLDIVREKMVVTSTVKMEYKKHRNSAFYAMKKRVQRASDNIKNQVESASKKISNSCDLLKTLQYPDIEELRQSLVRKLQDAEREIENFFEDRSVLKQISSIWEGRDLVSELFELIANKETIRAFTQEELYDICNEGEQRYKNCVPPGFADATNKDGIRKYSDLIIWKEIIGYAKEKQLNIIFVTDDVKEDWWEKAGVFHPKLMKEFTDETGMDIVPYTSIEFYSKVAADYGVEQNDAIEIALRATDQDYLQRIEHDVFEEVANRMMWWGDEFIDLDSAHIGTEGIDELEVVEYEFVHGFKLNRTNNKITYHMEYHVIAEGTSFDYWGRDDDTKQIILSPGTYHKFEGDIMVQVVREIEAFIDYVEDSAFDSILFMVGDLKETEFERYCECDYCDQEYADGYTYCPECGKPINFENDGLTGFCEACPKNH